MTYRALLAAAAEADLGRAVLWYQDHAPEQAGRLIDDYEAAVTRVCEFPHAAPMLRPDARRTALKVFPYQLWYYCHDSERIIEVVAIVHNRQDPVGFAGRLG